MKAEMVRKKIDNRIRVMIENGVAIGHRTMFVVIGDKGRDQVVILHHMLSKTAVKARPSVLWCYKKELGFTSHRKKRMKQLQKKIRSGKLDVNEEDPFELFIASTNIRYCYYSETHKILGNTYGMCILQDFEALTPNLLARTIETVEGGGLIVILLRTVNSLKQLYTMSMDVHTRYRTEAHHDVVGRFNERFILSLSSCKRCIVMDDQLNVLPLSTHVLTVTPVPPRTKEESLTEEEKQLKELKESLQDTQPVGALVNNCCTLDQAKALLKFIDAISEKTLRSTVALTAARGRGKSAALGLAIAAAVAFSYSNIFVTSPSPENLNTLFEFIFKGFDALEYQEHLDYEVVQSTNPEFNKAVIRVNIFHDHRQTVQYIHPSDAPKLGQAELVVIDEAAAIPLPLVKNLLGPYLVFMASTINGYEGTGRSLSLKLVQQLRQQMLTVGDKSKEATAVANMSTDKKASATGRVLHEIQLSESIRYKNGDDVEAWLNSLLCLDASSVAFLQSGCPVPQDCDLYYINRDTLFSFHRASETFLQRLMTLYVSSHYKNSPNDLQMMSDAPAHHLFCLLPPVSPQSTILPEVLCVIQVCLEGEISKTSIIESLGRGKRASGDLIPWTIAQQFQDDNFPGLSGARIVRIATHPNYQRMGYGLQALRLLRQYYEGKIMTIDEVIDANGSNEITNVNEEAIGILEETIAPRKSLPPLLLKLSERRPERLDYLGVSYGLTSELLKFWKKASFVPVYLRQTQNDLTGEHSCIMLNVLNADDGYRDTGWLEGFWNDFRRRFVALLSFQFRSFHPGTPMSLLTNNFSSANDTEKTAMTKEELDVHLTKYDLKRLELYSNNMVDYHLIMDLLPTLSRLYFLKRFSEVSLGALQACVLLGLGLQHKTVDDLAKELDLPPTQLLGIFNRIIRRLTGHLNSILEQDIAKSLPEIKTVAMEPSAVSLEEDLEEAADEVRKKQKKEKAKLLMNEDLSQFAIKGSEHEWQKALESGGAKSLVSLKSEKRKLDKKNTSRIEMKDGDPLRTPKQKKRFKK